VLSVEEVRIYLDLVRRVPVPEYLMLVARDLVRATRLKSEVAPSFVEDWIEWGASPRGSIEMILAAKAHAVLAGRVEVAVEDIRAVAPSILRHRIVTNYSAQSEWGFIERLVDAVIEEIMPSPKVRKSIFARFFERLLGTG
jgi:MoxR-like ATPase